MFELWPSGGASPTIKPGIGLIDVDPSLAYDGVCEMSGKIDSVLSAEVLNEMLLWVVSEKLLLSGTVFSLKK